MKIAPLKLVRSAIALTAICLSAAAAPPPTANAAIVAAANTFLSTLTEQQRKSVLFAFDDAQQRARWSNFPTGVVARSGMSLKQMNDTQRTAALALMKVVLSPMGYEKVDQIRLADDDFKANGSKRGGGGPPGGNGGQPRGNGDQPRGAGGPPPGGGQGGGPGGQNGQNGRPAFAGGDLFGKELYFISFLGTPSITSPWMLQFGGHHLALNITLSATNGIITPTLTGAQPAIFKLNGQTVRPLGRESDKALALLQSLDPTQKQLAILNYKVGDLVLGPGQDGKKIAPEGMKVSSMSDKQKAMLLDVIGEWAGILNDTAAAARMAQLKAELNDTFFAWSGPTSFEPGTNITAYYRIQGPHLVIEYAPQSDEPNNHVHTIYRDPTNDYGIISAATR